MLYSPGGNIVGIGTPGKLIGPRPRRSASSIKTMLDCEHNFRTGVSHFVLKINPKPHVYIRLDDRYCGKTRSGNGKIHALL
jgi:hypothetical protein